MFRREFRIEDGLTADCLNNWFLAAVGVNTALMAMKTAVSLPFRFAQATLSKDHTVSFGAHAWLESEGTIVIGGQESTSLFAPLGVIGEGNSL
jgi:hypothetical protein